MIGVLRSPFLASAALACAACSDGSLAVDIVLPDDTVARAGVSLLVSVYAPEGEVSCEQVAWRDVDDAALEPTLVVSAVVDDAVGSRAPLGDVPRDGNKLVVVRATSNRARTGEPLVAEGCAPVGAVGDDVARVTVELERTVVVALRPESPSQLITGVARGDPLALSVVDALEDRGREGAPLRITTPGAAVPLLEPASDADGNVDAAVDVAARGPFMVQVRARLEVGAGVGDVIGFQRPAPQDIVVDGATQMEIVRRASSMVGAAALVENALDASLGVVIAAPPDGSVVVAGAIPDAPGLGLVGRGQLAAAGPPLLFVHDASGALIALSADDGSVVDTFDPRGAFTFAGARIHALGPCAQSGAGSDDDLAPLLVTLRATDGAVGDDTSEVVVVAQGALVAARSVPGTVLTSMCARSLRTEFAGGVSRYVVVQERGTLVVLKELGPTGLVVPLAAGQELTIGGQDDVVELAALDVPVTFGSETRHGALVIAHREEVQLRLDRIDVDGGVVAGGGMALPGPPRQVGAAQLFDGDDDGALFALVPFGAGASAPILVVQGANGVVAAAPVEICVPADTCDVLAVDVDGDGADELVLAQRSTARGEQDDVARAQIWDFTP